MKNAIFTLLICLGWQVQAQVETVLHEVDVQLTFWEKMDNNDAGPLAVPGSKDLVSNIKKLKAIAVENDDVKAVSSIDYHFKYEIKNKENFPEFQKFPAHGMANIEGPLGAQRIQSVENAFLQGDKIYIPHHVETKKGEWKLVDYNVEQNKVDLLDTRKEIIIRKNGVGSYSVFANPRTDEIYKLLNPKKVIVYGVATDFCVHAAVMGLTERGYKVYVVKDAIAGIFPELIKTKTQEMLKAGAEFVSTEEALELINKK